MKSIDPKILSIAFTDKNLCTRSGTCIGICPENALSLDENYYPEIDANKCTECGLCAKTCPGGEVSFKNLTEVTFGHSNDSTIFDGHVKNIFVGYAVDKKIRSNGSGGGIVTALLWDLLKNKNVDGCIVTRMRKDKPWLGEYFIARTYEDLLESQGSRYSIIPLNSVFQEIRNIPGKFAYVALPCHIHGFRKAIQFDPVLKEKIHSVIGLFCGGALETNVVPELLQTKGISKNEIENFQFRAGEWPGRMQGVLKSGKVVNMHQSNYIEGGYNYLIGLYMPRRCQTCIDGSSEFSDLSIRDAWTRDKKGKYKFKAQSKIIIRTSKGYQILQQAIEHGTINAINIGEDPDHRTHQIHTKRKGLTAPLRVERLKKKGIMVPLYDRTVPDSTIRDRVTEYLVTYMLELSRIKIFRYSLIKFLTSKYGYPIIYIRIKLKKLRFRH